MASAWTDEIANSAVMAPRRRGRAGMIVAQVLIATPLITGITMAAMQLLPPALPDESRALGANRAQLVLRMWIEARVPLLAQLPIGCPAPSLGGTARVVFEPALSAVLPRATNFPVATRSGSANSLGPITPAAQIAHPVEPKHRQQGGVSTT
jgi:hypothetical protein